ncbi:MarR family transcriptional regulator [Myroides sp. 1354]|uniref:MarR family winged helix-turn-helix transcriptional regulator n=1 Tax=unclassified Myroides TaxID=2642485 RepID=UPI00257490FF|nr:MULTISPECIES: MarR family transcriptional regulator [unclassified Myroides]MDM1045445.1 MarR family transcriptional regulator [Myroides sp. R163-1]MDM1056318.1 MarR family transcriptional regulator [Myroides sp. 1354]MDM1069575.1 MarR family transcriptional regulator [Myroides sp. 1372]
MINDSLQLLFNLTKTQSILQRKFDRLSIHGLSYTDFMLLHLLASDAESKMRRIDLASRIGLTPSGVTRLLSPLEKNGLVGRESNARDARVSYVVLTETGQRIYLEAKVTAEAVALELLPKVKSNQLQAVMDLFKQIERE